MQKKNIYLSNKFKCFLVTQKNIFFVLIVCALILPACAFKSHKGLMLQNVITSFSSSIKAETAESIVECNLLRSSDQVAVITVKSPENINGMSFSWTGGEYEASYKGLSCRNGDVLLPKTSFANMVIKIIDQMSKGENVNLDYSDGSYSVFTGKCHCGMDYKVKVNNSSRFIEQIDTDGTTVYFSDQKII